MVAYGFIVGYVSLWLGWSSLVGVVLRPRDGSPARLGTGRVVSILVCALLPMGLLSLSAHFTRWFPALVLEMLSLMTPVLLIVFVVQRLGPLMGTRRDLAFDKRIRRDR